MAKKKKRETEKLGPWKDLPTDLLEPIAKQLGTIDFIMFRCVCKSWRSLASSWKQEFMASSWKQEFMASRPPLVLLFPKRKCSLLTCYLQEVINNNKLYKTTLPFSITDLSIRGLHRGFLIFQNEFESLKPRLWIMNLFTRRCLCFPHPERDLLHIIVGSCSKNPSDLVLIGYCSDYYLHFCRSSDPKWTVYEQYNEDSSIKGMTIINKKLYVLFRSSDVCVFEDLQLKQLPIKNEVWDSRLLVTDDKNRLLIVSNDHNVIYSMNWSEMMWEKVATREDTLLFKHRLRKTSFFWSLERTESVVRYCRPDPGVNLDRCLSVQPCKYLVQKGIQTISVNYEDGQGRMHLVCIGGCQGRMHLTRV